MSKTALYQLQNICKSFPLNDGELPVLKNLNLEIEAGLWHALTGRSGSGKTTLLHLLAGLDMPTSGKIIFQGKELTTMKARKLTALRRTTLGYIFQSYHLFPELSALENAVMPALHWGVNRAKAYQEAETRLVEFGLKDRLQHRPRELSGGEQQRVAIARSLVNHPDVILADEPTGNLDSAAANDIIEILQRLCTEDSKTIIMVTHDPRIAKLADRQIELETSM
ncbi:MAG: ABC transporter ATP-binding protein [Lentisphaeria bacterium]